MFADTAPAPQIDETAAMHSDETATTHSQTTWVFAFTSPASQSDEMAATQSPATSATNVETAFTKEYDMKDDDSVYSLSDVSDTEIEKLSVIMEHPEMYNSNAKLGE
jgi:hypothetical protein